MHTVLLGPLIWTAGKTTGYTRLIVDPIALEGGAFCELLRNFGIVMFFMWEM